jgi:hypothetical protein
MVGCTELATAALNTVTLQVDKGVKEKLRFLIDTGAQLSLCKYASIKEGPLYDPRRVINVKGISSYTESTLGEIEMVLSTENYEPAHTFHIVGDGIRIPYYGIIGQDFFESKRARIDYEKKEILMGDVRLTFDDTILSGDQGREGNIVLKAECETVVKVPTNAKELKTGVISKAELSPGVVMAETLTIVREGGCLTGTLNMNNEEVSVTLPIMNLGE